MTTALIYIGKDYENFSKESLDIGVNRRVPLNSLANLNWGDAILCAKFKKVEKRTGEAHVIGKFPLDRLSIMNESISEAVRDYLIMRGQLAVIEEPEVQIKRFCGQYIIGWVAEVTLTLPELVRIIREAGNRLGIPPKVMIGSARYEERDYTIPNVKFTRGVTIWGRLVDDTPEESVPPQFIAIKNYQQFGKEIERDVPTYRKLTDF